MANPHTQAAHEKCGGECEVARILVCLDESRKMVREEAAKAKLAERSLAAEREPPNRTDRAWREGVLAAAQWVQEAWDQHGLAGADVIAVGLRALATVGGPASGTVRQCPKCGGVGWPTAYDGCEVCHGDPLPASDLPRAAPSDSAPATPGPGPLGEYPPPPPAPTPVVVGTYTCAGCGTSVTRGWACPKCFPYGERASGEPRVAPSSPEDTQKNTLRAATSGTSSGEER